MILWCSLLKANSTKDSLLKIIRVEKQALKRLPAYGALAFELYRSNPDSSILIAQAGINLADSLKNKFHKASCLNMLGLAHYRKGWYSSAIKAYTESIKLFENEKEFG